VCEVSVGGVGKAVCLDVGRWRCMRGREVGSLVLVL
jgi:hypothetical protein